MQLDLYNKYSNQKFTIQLKELTQLKNKPSFLVPAALEGKLIFCAINDRIFFVSTQLVLPRLSSGPLIGNAYIEHDTMSLVLNFDQLDDQFFNDFKISAQFEFIILTSDNVNANQTVIQRDNVRHNRIVIYRENIRKIAEQCCDFQKLQMLSCKIDVQLIRCVDLVQVQSWNQ